MEGVICHDGTSVVSLNPEPWTLVFCFANCDLARQSDHVQMLSQQSQILARAALRGSRSAAGGQIPPTMSFTSRTPAPNMMVRRGYAEGPGVKEPGPGTKGDTGGERRWPPKIWKANLTMLSVLGGATLALSWLSTRNSSKDQ